MHRGVLEVCPAVLESQTVVLGQVLGVRCLPTKCFAIYLITVVNVCTGAINASELRNWMEQWIQYLILKNTFGTVHHDL